MADDPGVMGNLPRSRPGRRSEKRASGAAKKGSGSAGGAKGSAGRAKASAGGAKASGSRAKTAGGTSRAKATAGGASRAKAAGGSAKASSRAKAGAGRAKTTSRAKASAPRAKVKTAGPRASAGGPGRAQSSAERAPRHAVREERVEERQGQDPITAALRAGMAVGDIGVKVLSKIVQRLPRP